ncbi:MAG: ATP-binding cassette domain-containing protein [Acidobacteria bacterium]|nr:ATP-binding cassette domain-containing protein [Acidobacteriota bacterium]
MTATENATPGAPIELRAVSKSFGPRKVLEECSFKVTAGTAFVLLGRSGTGKSVTLKLICGLIKPDAGAVFVNGEDITPLDSNALAVTRKHLGFLFQTAALFDSISVGENVAFPLRRRAEKPDPEIRNRAAELLESVGLGNEYDTMPSELSGGMRKRAGLARALAVEPSILLVDEPSAGLDPITSSEIDQLLLKIKTQQKTTLVIVTHNIPSARRVGDRFAFLDGGRLLAEGTADELTASENPLVRDFMKSQQAG